MIQAWADYLDEAAAGVKVLPFRAVKEILLTIVYIQFTLLHD
jgi:hypothetical protein